HSQRKTKRVQRPNLVTKKIFVPELNRTITLKVAARTLRTMNKKGVHQVLKEYGIKV
ncbi:MAG: 50S ribosomal protein L28, partial [Candidatus Latescibacterota bacterium]|nr:50S ribosomal protein L28 [Candidatus Latescibacterota bacterium]